METFRCDLREIVSSYARAISILATSNFLSVITGVREARVGDHGKSYGVPRLEETGSILTAVGASARDSHRLSFFRHIRTLLTHPPGAIVPAAGNIQAAEDYSPPTCHVFHCCVSSVQEP